MSLSAALFKDTFFSPFFFFYLFKNSEIFFGKKKI